MKPASFELLQPTTRAEALTLLAEAPDDTVILAGGQSLVPLMNMRFVVASRVLDLNRVNELEGIERQNGALVVGAMTRHREAELSELVHAHCPLLAQAERHVGYVSIRNRGTVGGTIAHADTVGQVPCVAVALDAQVVLESTRGRREMAASEFFVGNLTNARDPDEILTAVHLPVRPAGSASGFAEFARKVGDFPLLTAAVQIERDAGQCSGARIAVGGAAPTPIRLPECEAALAGQTLNDSLVADVAALAAECVEPSETPFVSGDYRRHLAGVVVRRSLEQALSDGEEGI
ncbi:MAG: FAD binding domain-containing protein [Solirubrobacteraceae bacterium]